MRREAHPLAGQTVKLTIKPTGNPKLDDELKDQEYRIEDWWENIAGRSWMVCDGNPACLQYAMRSGFNRLPTDNEVVYGKVGSLGHLIHISELGEVIPGE